jgi:uncharacterized protein
MYVREETTYRTKPSDDQRRIHLKFLREQGDKGKVVMAGRLADGLGALIIWEVESVEEAQKIASGDPYAKAGLVAYTLREWAPTFDYTKNPPVTPS